MQKGTRNLSHPSLPPVHSCCNSAYSCCCSEVTRGFATTTPRSLAYNKRVVIHPIRTKTPVKLATEIPEPARGASSLNIRFQVIQVSLDLDVHSSLQDEQQSLDIRIEIIDDCLASRNTSNLRSWQAYANQPSHDKTRRINHHHDK